MGLFDQKEDFQKSGFNFGFHNQNIDKIFDKMINDFEEQKRNLTEVKEKELENTEKLIEQNQKELQRLRELRAKESISIFAFNPWLILFTFLFFGIGWWIIRSKFLHELHLIYSLLIFIGVWSIITFLFFNTPKLINWFTKNVKVYKTINSFVLLTAMYSLIFNSQYYVFIFVLIGSVFLSSLNLILYTGSSLIRYLDQLIKRKEKEINELEELKNTIYKDIWKLIKSIENTKTDAILKFHKGYIYGRSLNIK